MKIAGTVFALLLFAAACKKDKEAFDPAMQAKKDDQVIRAYIADHQLAAQRDTSGLYYIVEDPGTGAVPTPQSKITVTYVGMLADSTVFEQSSDPVAFVLHNVIPGWQIGLQKIKAGGKIFLMVPSALGYGPGGNGPIPPNSVLLFEISLRTVEE